MNEFIPADTDVDEIRELALPDKLSDESAQRILFWHQAGLIASQESQRADDLRMIAAALWTKGDANIKLAALAFVGGLSCTEGKSMAKWAKELGCSRAAISKEANKWSDRLHIRSAAMKSQEARDNYHRRQVAVCKKQPTA